MTPAKSYFAKHIVRGNPRPPQNGKTEELQLRVVDSAQVDEPLSAAVLNLDITAEQFSDVLFAVGANVLLAIPAEQPLPYALLRRRLGIPIRIWRA